MVSDSRLVCRWQSGSQTFKPFIRRESILIKTLHFCPKDTGHEFLQLVSQLLALVLLITRHAVCVPDVHLILLSLNLFALLVPVSG